ncbi:succinate-semialdehyde dehydrogenase (NADP(+)), partial [Pseudomonas sp. FSL R10-0765]|nr:succinate-semialdehyde dehydrogenase (NADP(+)) [Pseudomonas sp. FSL R10-0765]
MQLKDPQLFRQQAFIDGAWADADSRQTVDVTNPAQGQLLGTVPLMGGAEAIRAIQAADA